MKKILALVLALMLLATLAACGTVAPTPTDAPASTGAAETEGAVPGESTAGQETAADVYSFLLGDAELVPGTAFDPSVLPEAASVSQVPSCAIEGTDNVYNYGTVEVTAFADGNGETIYSVYVLDANTPTPEGLHLGDNKSTVESIYGTEYTENGTELTYQRGNTLLVLILENNCVASIEYRAVTD